MNYRIFCILNVRLKTFVREGFSVSQPKSDFYAIGLGQINKLV